MIAEGKELFLDSVDCGNNFFYVLNDAQIVPTEYKVLHNQKDSTFVKCMNFKYNGKDSVFYFLNDLLYHLQFPSKNLVWSKIKRDIRYSFHQFFDIEQGDTYF